MQKKAELYRGKAKTVYTTEDPDLLILGSAMIHQHSMASVSNSLTAKVWSIINLTILL